MKKSLLAIVSLLLPFSSYAYNEQQKSWYGYGNWLHVETTVGCINENTMYESHKITPSTLDNYWRSTTKWRFILMGEGDIPYNPARINHVDLSVFGDSNNNVTGPRTIFQIRPYQRLRGKAESSKSANASEWGSWWVRPSLGFDPKCYQKPNFWLDETE